MKFLLDVHISTGIAQALLAGGHDVVRASIAHATWSDVRLLALAVSETRVIVTEDSDFSDLVYALSEPPPPAIVYIRCEPADQSAMIARVIDVVGGGRLNGHMVVIKTSNTRYRPLPGTRAQHG